MCTSVFAWAKTDTRAPTGKTPIFERSVHHEPQKLLLTLTLCLCALLCMVVTASASEVSVYTNHFSCGVVGCQNNDHGHTQVTEWQPWTGPQSASKDNIPYDSNTKTAYIYLANNVEIEDALTIPRGHTLYLCLNGHDIIRTGNLIQIQEDASFTLCDCKGDKAEYGKLDSNKGGRVVSFESGKPGTFTMYGGIITGGNITGNSGGGVFVGDKIPSLCTAARLPATEHVTPAEALSSMAPSICMAAPSPAILHRRAVEALPHTVPSLCTAAPLPTIPVTVAITAAAYMLKRYMEHWRYHPLRQRTDQG